MLTFSFVLYYVFFLYFSFWLNFRHIFTNFNLFCPVFGNLITLPITSKSTNLGLTANLSTFSYHFVFWNKNLNIQYFHSHVSTGKKKKKKKLFTWAGSAPSACGLTVQQLFLFRNHSILIKRPRDQYLLCMAISILCQHPTASEMIPPGEGLFRTAGDIGWVNLY